MTAPAVFPTVTVDGVSLLFRVGGASPLPTDIAGVEWICTKLEGWAGAPKPRTARTDKPFGPGAFRSRSFAGSRIIAVEFVVTAPDVGTIRLVEQQLAAWCSDGGRLYDMTVLDPPLRPQVAKVELDDAVLTKPRTWCSLDVSTQFVAPDPRKWDQYWTDRTTLVPVPSNDGADFSSGGVDFSTPGLSFGLAPIVSSALIANYGTAAVGPFITVTVTGNGTVATPRITDLISGWSMVYAGALVTGDVLTINCDEFGQRGQGGHSCLLNGVTNVWSQVVRSGDWPVIDPQGVANYQITASPTSSAAAVLVVSVRSAWL